MDCYQGIEGTAVGSPHSLYALQVENFFSIIQSLMVQTKEYIIR